MGTDCPVEPIEASVVKVDDDTYYLLGSQIVMKYTDPKELRAAALAKLTDEDKEILGLKRRNRYKSNGKFKNRTQF
jgi:hypothetical protein